MLPARIYVKTEEDGDDEYLVADCNARNLVEVHDDDGTEIGEYRLVRKAKYTMQIKEIN